ncbi:hypothetical protein ADEAN_000543500 [Angomonas deanei]|uniref:NTF2 domain-containing protein n=1 Tax=Angomonas deanei TaxID=59799 RepID=A0A7G2CEL1_9TRYP|nr:hypothetical protein ADEAN_000543500 [Angomonas deanei]
MSTQQIASSFVVEFFERFAKNPERLAEFYGQPSVVTFSDFELGIDQVYEKDVGPRMFQYASALQGSQLRVDAMTAATLCNGVDIFVTLSAVSQVKEEFFHITTTLESYPNAYDAQSFFIRHQVIARIGESNAPVQQQQQEIPVEARAPVEEPAQAPVEVEEKPVEVPEVAPAVSNTRTPEPERVEQPEPVTAPAEPEKEATPVKATNAQPKSWLDLASAAKGSTITVKSAARVVVGGEAPPRCCRRPCRRPPEGGRGCPRSQEREKGEHPSW